MEIEQPSIEVQLLRHADRQTKALENLNTYFMRLVAVLAFLALVVVIAWVV